MSMYSSILSIDIEHGEIFLHFRSLNVGVSAWNRKTKRYQYFNVQFERAVSIAAKAMNRKDLVEPLGEQWEAAQ